ncbi:MAG: hypothetical protein PHD03_04385 [Bacilli bacterium]|nr:hypothetical protein [Bacilli bacterium]MDD4407271.1 hypothetical protein [Bacilli bacterium]
MFIKNIARNFERLIYIFLGIIAATIIFIPFTPLPTDGLVEIIEEITEILLFTIIILLPAPTILNKYIKIPNYNSLNKVVYVLRNIHIALGVLFIGLRILHMEIIFLFESIEWNFEMITSILLSLILIPTVICAILRINNSKKYRKIHLVFLTLTYLSFILHLFD